MEVVISGASEGVGKAIVKLLADQNCNLHLIARDIKKLNSLKEEINNEKFETSLYSADLSKESEINTIDFNFQTDEFILINNLGIYLEDTPSALNEEYLIDQLNTNLLSAIRLTKKLIPFMLKSGSGKIINIGSQMSINGSSIASSYSISKHGLKAWSDGLREELRSKNILVSSIFPGAINTSSWDGIKADRSSMIQAEDVAKIIKMIIEIGDSSIIEEVIINPRDFNA